MVVALRVAHFTYIDQHMQTSSAPKAQCVLLVTLGHPKFLLISDIWVTALKPLFVVATAILLWLE